jgi:hypothetical protein
VASDRCTPPAVECPQTDHNVYAMSQATAPIRQYGGNRVLHNVLPVDVSGAVPQVGPGFLHTAPHRDVRAHVHTVTLRVALKWAVLDAINALSWYYARHSGFPSISANLALVTGRFESSIRWGDSKFDPRTFGAVCGPLLAHQSGRGVRARLDSSALAAQRY